MRAGRFFPHRPAPAGCSRAPLLIGLLAAFCGLSCGVHYNRLTPHDYARIRNQAEILSYHASRPQIEIYTYAEAHDAGESDDAEDRNWVEEILFGLLEELFFSYDPEKAEKELRYADELLALPLGDPVQQVEDGFLSGLEAALGSRNQWVAEEPLSWAQIDLQELQAQVPGAVVVHFQTTRWQLVPARDKKYRLRYEVQAQATRLEDLKTIWLKTCKYNHRFLRGAPYKILRRLARADGAQLKDAMEEATSQCIDELLADFTDRPGPEAGSDRSAQNRYPD